MPIRRLASFPVVLIGCFFLLLARTDASLSNRVYRTVQKDGVWWLQAPDGSLLFSMGVNVVSQGTPKDRYQPSKPGYAAFRHYESTSAWKAETLKRLQRWRFNTIGGWSDPVWEEGPLPFTVVLGLGESSGAPWGDLFSAATAEQFERAAKTQIASLRDNPYLLGYFSDNELGWWPDALFAYYIKQPGPNRTRAELIRLLRRRYQNNFAALQKDFHVGAAKTFDQVGHRGDVTFNAPQSAADLVDQFVSLLAGKYYQLCHDVIRRHDPNHLILGDRYASWYPQAVAKAAAPYVDVISTNYMADWNSGEISSFYLETLHALTGKPILITEFYMAATENRSGNKNSRSLFPTVTTQGERAAAFRANVESLAKLPFVVGAHWFQYSDEPTLGRESDGEDYNMGLVDIEDRPYEELVAQAQAVEVVELHSRARVRSSAIEAVAAPLVDHPYEVSERRQALMGPDGASAPFADLFTAWRPESLSLVLLCMDHTTADLYPHASIPDGALPEWAVTVHSGPTRVKLEVRFGLNNQAVVTGARATASVQRKSTRWTVLLELPASTFGKIALAPGDSFSVQSSLTSFNRLRTMNWSQPITLATRPGPSRLQSSPD